MHTASGCPDPSMSRAMKTTACRGTCANKPCKVVPNVATDICICPAGKVLFDGFCVPNKDCGCVDEKGSARQVGAVLRVLGTACLFWFCLLCYSKN